MSVSDYINASLAILALVAIFVSIFMPQRQIKESRNQLTKQIEEGRRLATEERQHQSCPMIVPKNAIADVPAAIPAGEKQQYLYTREKPPLKGTISWSLPFGKGIPIEISNLGTGPAVNVHFIFHGYDPIYENQFISWNNGPIGAGKDVLIYIRHPYHGELALNCEDTLDGVHTLFYSHGAPNPNQAQARLTMTFQDIFGNKLVNIFDYTAYHEWITIYQSLPSSPKIALDLKELNDQKKNKKKP